MPRTLRATFTSFGRKSGSAFQHGTTSSSNNGGIPRGRQVSKHRVGGFTVRSERAEIHRTKALRVSKGSLVEGSSRTLLPKAKDVKRTKFVIPAAKSIAPHRDRFASRLREQATDIDKFNQGTLSEVLSSNQFVGGGLIYRGTR